MGKWQQKIADGVTGHLEPGETVLAAMSAAVKGRGQTVSGNFIAGELGAAQQRRSRAAAEAAGLALPSGTIGLVVTNRRLLLASLGVGAKVKELASSLPVSAVEAVTVKRVGLGATITLSVYGAPIKLEGRVGPGREIAAAWQQARAAAA